jgi:hypothetical protein
MTNKPKIELSDSRNTAFSVRFIYLHEVTKVEIKWPRRLPKIYINKVIIGECIEIDY